MEWNAGFLSLIPPILAITCALITKEVVFSLILGVLSGTIIFSVMQGLGVLGVFDQTVTLMGGKLADNVYIILFLCFLGILVTLVARAGGSKLTANGQAKSSKARGVLLLQHQHSI